jgi:hypothetical protein
MKLTLSKAEEVDGKFTVDAQGEALGHMQVYGMTLAHRAISVTVSNAGTILVDRLPGDFAPGTWGSITQVKDVILHSPEAPKKIPVRGTATLQGADGSKTITPFSGVLYTTGYLQRAWSSVLDPDWNGNWDF